MATITISDILDDLRAADEITRYYERRYGLSSADFNSLYQQGRLDDGEHTDEFAEWSAYYKVKVDREVALQAFSGERVRQLVTQVETIKIEPLVPSIN
ncbi:MAG: hypothetical protein AB1512_04605 [Thermodesulfobacteriota bacterium]